jgi:hypothetical protein
LNFFISKLFSFRHKNGENFSSRKIPHVIRKLRIRNPALSGSEFYDQGRHISPMVKLIPWLDNLE